MVLKRVGQGLPGFCASLLGSDRAPNLSILSQQAAPTDYFR